MNRLKVVLIAAAAMVAIALLAVLLAFSSGVQTWAARRALAGQPGLKADIGRVAAGLSSAELRDVRIEKDGTVIVAKEITASYSATDYLSGHRINVGSVALHGVEIDARKSATAQPAAASSAALAPFAGVLNAIRLPGEVRLGHIEADAKVLLPDNRTAQLTLDGGGIAPGEFGTLKWKATFADAQKGAPLASAQVEGAIKVRTTADLRIDVIDLNADAAATGPNLPPDHVKLAVKLEQPAANAGETIAADVSLARGSTAEKLFGTRVAYAAGKPVMSGTWNLAVRSEQFAAVLAAFGLPEVALTGEGSFTYNVDTSAATASGTVNGKISRLEKLGDELAAIGSLQVRAAFDGGSSKDSAQLGKLDFEIATADGRKLVTVAAQQKLSFSFKDKRVTPERPGSELARVALTAVPLAWAQPVLKPRTISGDVSGVFVVEAELDGSRVKARAVEPLTIRSATVREGDKTLVDRVTLAVSPSVDYTAARIVADAQKLTVSTPDGDTLTGALSADVTTGAKPATAFSAQLQGKLAALVKPYLPADAAPLAVVVNAKGRLEGKSLQISALSLKADRAADSTTLAAIEALQPLTIDLDKQKLAAPDAAKPAARVRWGAVPLAWVQPYVANSKFAGQLAAGALEVTLAGADAVTIRALEPIAARGTTVALSGQQWLNGADLTTDLNATWKGGTLTADVQHLEIRQGNTSVLTAAFSGDVTPGKTLRANGHGSVSADFSVLAQQPALAAQLPLIRGAVNVKFDGACADGVNGKVTISGQNLVAREQALPLGSMDLSIDAKLDANNSGTVRNLLVVTKDGRKSDLLLDGKVGVKPGAISFEGRVTGDQIIVDDMQAFAALGAPPPAASPVAQTPATRAPRPTATTAAKPVTGPVKDTTPVWAGFTGRVDVNINTIKQGTGTTVKNLRGVFSARPDRLTAENLSLELNGNPIKFATILSFDVKQTRPYALVGTFQVPSFDVGEYLRRSDPKTPPALETKVTIDSKFNGTAANLAEFQDRLMGQFELKGSKGVLRALNKKAETTSAVSGLLGLAAGLAGQQRLAQGLNATSELVSQLKDIQFDSLTVQVDRGADAAINVKSIELLSPQIHITGNGRIDHKAGEDFGNNPLSLEIQLAAKGQVANGLNSARQLSGKTDAKGYYLMATPFTMGGTVSNPDSSAFWKNLTLNTGAGFLGR